MKRSKDHDKLCNGDKPHYCIGMHKWDFGMLWMRWEKGKFSLRYKDFWWDRA